MLLLVDFVLFVVDCALFDTFVCGKQFYTRDSVNHGRPNFLMGKVHTRYCGLVLGSHVEN